MNEESIFAEAVKIESESRREAFLKQACQGDGDLQQRIENLLREHDQPDEMFDDLTKDYHAGGNEKPPQTIGEFEIIGELGRGGMGVVYEAEQTSLKRRVALKVLSSRLGLTARAVLRFRREAEAAAKLHHTNIVPIYATGEDQGVHYYAMELIAGPALDQVIRHLKEIGSTKTTTESEEGDATGGSVDQRLPDWVDEKLAYETPKSNPGTGSLDPSSDTSSGSNVASGTPYFDNVATMMAEAADALDHAHEHGVIHRDIKPSNLLLGPDGRLSINDFGLARVLEQPGMTVSGEFVGTPRYMSPEQITAGRAPLDHRTDIYSLGATLHELLTLQPAFPGQRRDEVIGQILHREPRPPRKLNRKIPGDLETICIKAMERDPGQRYQTAGQMASDLTAFVNRHAISARRIGPLGKTLRWIQHHPTATALVVVSLVAITSIAWIWKQDQNRRLNEANRRLKDAMEHVFLHAITGEFGQAEKQLELARSLGADPSWLVSSEAEILIYQGKPDQALELLRESGDLLDKSIRFQSLEAITYFHAEEELDYFEKVATLSEVAKFAEANSQLSAMDELYLGIAFSWAEPIKSIEFLESASQHGAPSGITSLIRSYANTNLATDATNNSDSLDFAKTAVRDGHSAVKIYRSPYSLAVRLSAETAAALACGRSGDFDGRQTHKRLASQIDRDLGELAQNKSVREARYLYKQQLESEDEALKYLYDLDPKILDNSSLAYRVIGQIAEGQVDLAAQDFKRINERIEHKRSFLTLALLSNATTETDFVRIKSNFATYIDQKLHNNEADEFASHWEFDWAACRLLGLDLQAEKLSKLMMNKSASFKSTFVVDYFKAVTRVNDGESIKTIVASGKESRMDLCITYFAAGIDRLAEGNRDEAKQHFDQCVENEFVGFYAAQTARAFLRKWKTDPNWLPHGVKK